MKNLALLVFISGCLLVFSCSKDDTSERFKLLTTPVWATDSLLANGVDASVAGGVLEKFKGDAKFQEDGTGYFGKYTGTWRFNVEETQITIITDSLPLPIITNIKELTKTSLKVTTVVPNPLDQLNPFNIRMTFKAK
ncbi:MAG: hypothetical protein A2V50_06855 [Bacteroidetes bacterium RBG_19FT_COMBO_42_10]|nr:MAG: hypothetical protein A2V50_06855 [Bacteroidetes bacterium RBG_19FT_COMBO_42_10]